MNFTREPTIESVISSREGYKLSIRNSKKETRSEYQQLDSIEVVSFGHQVFFRSLDRPKSFILPVADYEIVEVRETRLLIKNPSVEKNVKISIDDEQLKLPSSKDESDKKDAQSKKKRRGRTKKIASTEKPTTNEPIDISNDEDKSLQEKKELTKNLFRDLLTPPQMLISDAFGKDDADLSQNIAKAPDITLPEIKEQLIEEVSPAAKKPKAEKKKVSRKRIAPPAGLVEIPLEVKEAQEKKVKKKSIKKKVAVEKNDAEIVT